MNAKHTPRLKVRNGTHYDPRDLRAIARLIAAAPDLLASLERLANAASAYAGLDPAVASARTAIARAKGGAE